MEKKRKNNRKEKKIVHCGVAGKARMMVREDRVK
jgi:hypothetical protein